MTCLDHIKFSVTVLAGYLAMLSQVFHGFCQSLEENPWAVRSNYATTAVSHVPCHTSFTVIFHTPFHPRLLIQRREVTVWLLLHINIKFVVDQICSTTKHTLGEGTHVCDLLLELILRVLERLLSSFCRSLGIASASVKWIRVSNFPPLFTFSVNLGGMLEDFNLPFLGFSQTFIRVWRFHSGLTCASLQTLHARGVT